MTSLAVVSRPYARAAFEVAHDKGQLAEWSRELVLAAEVVRHPELAQLLGNPRIDRQQIADVVISACGDQLSQGVSNLLKLMAENRRLSALPDVADTYEALRAEAEQRLPVSVRSAVALDKEQRHALEEKLTQRFGQAVEARYSIDADLIGGAVIEAGDVLIDGSLRNKLERLRGALHKG